MTALDVSPARLTPPHLHTPNPGGTMNALEALAQRWEAAERQPVTLGIHDAPAAVLPPEPSHAWTFRVGFGWERPVEVSLTVTAGRMAA